MHKIGFILLIFGVWGCSVFQPAIKTEPDSEIFTGSNNIEEIAENQNITGHNFFLQKARIEYISNGENHSFLVSVKFLFPDSYLISLRSKAGIEAARIYITKDTVIINDRINRQILYGKPLDAARKFGVTSEILPLFFGDFVRQRKSNFITTCDKGVAIINSSINGARVRYVLDCKVGKVIAATRAGSIGTDSYEFNFEKFNRAGKKLYPSNIRIGYSDIKVIINIDKIEYPWSGEIEFIPGKNYELIELL